LSFLSEAADDICYRVIDIEDAVELGILSIEKAKELYVLMLGDAAPDGHATMGLSQLRATVVGKLIGSFWDVFEADYENIMGGGRSDDLKAGVPNWLKEALSQVKETNKKIFSTEKKIRLEIGAYKILGGILKALAKATLVYSQERCISKVPFIAKRCLELAWDEQYLIDNADQPYSWWLHEILDFISGLTDDHAYLIANAIGGVGQE
jgi:dGTPase